MTASLHDARSCHLGEGPLWHPLRGQLFWFDILGQRLLSHDATGPLDWDMGERASAAGWIDEGHLLIASETGLSVFHIASGARDALALLQADQPATRSNDGRTDPQGGFWVGTMGVAAQPGAGAIHRYYRGEIRTLFDRLTIPNGICFAPGGDRAYFADTVDARIMTVALDALGWPSGAPQVFVDYRGGAHPDGAVCDAAGNLWSAQWGAGRVAVHAPDGRFLKAVPVPAAQSTCPAFGGARLTDLYVTTAREGLGPDARTDADGQTFHIPNAGQGLAEHRVIP